MWLENLSGTLAVREHKAGWGLGSWGLCPPPVVISSARLCFPSGPQGAPPERLVPLVTGGGWAVTRSVGIGLSAQAGPLPRCWGWQSHLSRPLAGSLGTGSKSISVSRGKSGCCLLGFLTVFS